VKIKCDFCGASPNWAYPADDYEIVVQGIATGHASRSAWAACDRCHTLIESGNRAGLAKRAGDWLEAQGDAPPGAIKWMREHMQEFHDQFFAHRTGPGEPLGVV
jgi:hypothetical protein